MHLFCRQTGEFPAAAWIQPNGLEMAFRARYTSVGQSVESRAVSDGDAEERGGREYRETSLTEREAHSSSRWRKRATEDGRRLNSAVRASWEAADGEGSRSAIIKSADLERPAHAASFEVPFCSYRYERLRFALTHRLHSIKLISARRKPEQAVLFYFCSVFPVEMGSWIAC